MKRFTLIRKPTWNSIRQYGALGSYDSREHAERDQRTLAQAGIATFIYDQEQA